jgi:hypothetical protein
MKNKIIVPKLLKDPKNKPAFPDDLESLKGIDRTFATYADFDWKELENLLGEAKELDEQSIEKLAQVLRGIVAWCIASRPGTINLKKAALRIVALAWVIDPEFFDGASLAELARRGSMKSPSTLARQTGEASRVFGIRNHAQSHASGTWRNPPDCNVSR